MPVDGEDQKVVLRPELRQFAEALELRLRENDHKSGWDQMSPDQCLRRAHVEMHELDEAAYSRKSGQPIEPVLHEVEDTANFLFFLWWNQRRVGP